MTAYLECSGGSRNTFVGEHHYSNNYYVQFFQVLINPDNPVNDLKREIVRVHYSLFPDSRYVNAYYYTRHVHYERIAHPGNVTISFSILSSCRSVHLTCIQLLYMHPLS